MLELTDKIAELKKNLDDQKKNFDEFTEDKK